MEKPYFDYWKFCNENQLKRSEIVASKIYQFLTTNQENGGLNLVENETLMIANIQSLSLKSDPSRLRIRNDKFLKLARAKIQGGLISGIKIRNQQYFLFFSTKYFFNDDIKVNQSNSFITFTYDDLVNNYTRYGFDTIIEKRSKINQSKIFFYVCTDTSFDLQVFKSFNQKITAYNDYPLVNQTKLMFIPPIADHTKNNVRSLYHDFCALVSKDQDGEYVCPCNQAIDLKFLKENDLNYTDLHHFAPKKFLAKLLKNNNQDINWNIIHDQINLIPLCVPCHSAIHKGKNQDYLVTKVFRAIIKSYQKNNRYEDFVNYLRFNFNLSVADLLKVYLKTDLD